MPRTPPRTRPARPLTVSVCCQRRKRKRKSKAGRALRALVVGSEPFSAGKRLRPLLVSVRPTASESSRASATPRSTSIRHRETVEGGAGGAGRTVGAMGPRHASGGLGRTPNPGLAVCAGQRTRARRQRAPMDGFTACPACPSRPAKHAATQSHEPRCCCCLCLRSGLKRVPGSARPGILSL